MSKDMKIEPELRFPEFENEGEWKTDSLGHLVEIKGRIGYRGYTRADIVEEGKGAITLSPSNFEDSGSLNFEKCTYITWEKYEESPEIMLEEGQTVLVKTASVGKSAYVKELPEKATINPQIVVLKPLKIEPKFLAYSIFHNYVQVQIKGAVGAGAIPNMSQDSISKFDILLPPDKKGIEQLKIASCLSSLDELIVAHTDKLEALKDHKKGLLQNLFPQEGETVPRFRFPEFEDDGEWVERSLGEIGEFVGGGTPSTSNSEYWDGEILWYTPTEVKNGVLSPSIRTITQKGLQNSSAKLLPIGTILITTRATIGAAAITNVVCTTNQGFQSLVVKKSEHNQFWYYWIIHHKHELEKRSSGSTFKEIGKTEIKTVPTLSPKKGEQQKIASCLSAVDDLITVQHEKIKQLQQHKKGLMQGLFPKIEN